MKFACPGGNSYSCYSDRSILFDFYPIQHFGKTCDASKNQDLGTRIDRKIYKFAVKFALLELSIIPLDSTKCLRRKDTIPSVIWQIFPKFLLGGVHRCEYYGRKTQKCGANFTISKRSSVNIRGRKITECSMAFSMH